MSVSFSFYNTVKLKFKRHVLPLAWCPDGLVIYSAEISLTLFNSVPLTMWASQQVERCAIRNFILRKELSHLWPRRERFMCAEKPFEGNCILLSFCACNIVCSSLYGDRGSCTCALSRPSSHPALCLFVYSITVWTHLPICLWMQCTCLLVRAVTFECIRSRPNSEE